MRTNVYIDGFNFYYGCVKDTPHRWLDFSKLLPLLLPGHQINRIRYFTALVLSTQSDPTKTVRQQTYIRALETIPNFSVHYGMFLRNRTRMPLANPPAGGPNTVEVIKTEEKGSDVNLATYLLIDYFMKDFDIAVIVSNDSDLLEPIKFVRSMGMQVGILNPHKNTSWALKNAADFYRPIRQGPVRASQFPPTLTDSQGRVITKPSGW